MLIIWNSTDYVWELKFAAGDEWKNDLECAKNAKFKTSGPPYWVWYTDKVKNLKFLQQNKPSSGLEITTEALEEFRKADEKENEHLKIVKQFKDAKAKLEGKPTEDEKEAKRQEKIQKRVAKGLTPKPTRRPRQARGGGPIKHEVIKY
jgi:hypothetical protein